MDAIVLRRYLNATGLMWESGPDFGAVLVVRCCVRAGCCAESEVHAAYMLHLQKTDAARIPATCSLRSTATMASPSPLTPPSSGSICSTSQQRRQARRRTDLHRCTQFVHLAVVHRAWPSVGRCCKLRPHAHTLKPAGARGLRGADRKAEAQVGVARQRRHRLWRQLRRHAGGLVPYEIPQRAGR